MASDLEQLALRLRSFAERRNWQQFHTPRNLVLALVGEVGELAAEFQWIDDEDVREALDTEAVRSRVEDEIADVLIYLTRLADRCEIDLIRAANAKVTRNEERYPEDAARGVATKYTDL